MRAVLRVGHAMGDDGAFERHDRLARRRAPRRPARGCRRRGGRFRASWYVSGLASSSHFRGLGAQGTALRQTASASIRAPMIGFPAASTAAAMPSRSASRSGRPRIIAATVAAGQRIAGAGHVDDLSRRGRLDREDMPAASKPMTRFRPAVITPLAAQAGAARDDRRRRCRSSWSGKRGRFPAGS